MKRALGSIVFLIAALAAQQTPSAPTISSLEQLPHGFYFQSGLEWKKLEGVRSSRFSPQQRGEAGAGVLPSGIRFFAGPESSNHFVSPKPVFGIRLDPLRPDVRGFSVRDLLIVRVSTMKDHRELEVPKGGFASMPVGINTKDVTELVISPVGDHAFTAVPKSDLAAGEYLVFLRRSEGIMGYDFAIRK